MRWLPSLPWLVLGVFALVVLLALVVTASTSAVAFGAYNVNWDGTSELRSDAETVGDIQVLLDAEEYDETEPDSTVAIVLRPAESYDQADRERLARFVENGGTVIVAENFGPHGDDLLAATGAEARFDGDLLRDEEHHFRSPAMPLATNVTRDSPATNETQAEYRWVTRDVDQLTLNYGTAIEPNGAQTLVRTSPLAYLDPNTDSEFDPDDDDLRSYPVVTAEAVGDGTVVAVGDPSVFINAMIDEPDNRQFVRNIVGSERTAVLDVSHAGSLPPLTLALLIVRGSSLLSAGIGLLVVGIVSLVARYPHQLETIGRRFITGETVDSLDQRDRDGSDEKLVAKILSQNPEWDEERVRRVIRTVEVGRWSSDDNE